MKKSFLVLLIVVALVIVGLFITVSRTGNRSVPSSVNSLTTGPGELAKLPQLNLKDYNGKTINIPADFAGKPLIINAWATWCPFCKKELPDFAALEKEFKDKVVVIAIDRSEPLDVAKKYSDERGVTNDLVFLLDPQDSFYQSIGGFSMPETIFVDASGTIREHKRGPMDLQEMREKTTKLLSS